MESSKINPKITIQYLLTERENQYFERKGTGQRDIKQSKIADELIGMLNADGGVLAFGISDKGELQDLREAFTDAELDKYRKLFYDYITPMCSVYLEEFLYDNYLVFLYHVEIDHERLFKRKDSESVFLRIHDSNRKLDLDGIKRLEYDKTIRKYEDEVQSDFDWDDLDEKVLDDYKNRLSYSGSSQNLLLKRFLANKKDGVVFIKNSGVLLFSQNPEKYIPSASVRYIRYDGKKQLTGANHNVIKDERFEDNIPNLIDRLRQFLKASFKDYYFLDLQEGKFKKVPEYSEEAWLEGIVNALCHRSYNVQGNSTYLKHYDDRIEISNSGPLPAQVTIDNIKTERYARNPRLAITLEDLKYVRQLNEGVSRIYESMEKSMLSKPEYLEKNRNIHLILKNKISVHSKTIDDEVMLKVENKWNDFNDSQKKILHYLFKEQSATIKELANFVEININTLRVYLNGLIDDDILFRNSDKKRDINAKYMFKKDV
ncbi:MAG: ATP-binding protein [Nonlabens sp.]